MQPPEPGAKRRHIPLLVLLAALAMLAMLAVGCAGPGPLDRYARGTESGGSWDGGHGEPAPVAAATADGAPEATVGASPDAPAGQGGGQGGGTGEPAFGADPRASGGSGYEADTLLRVHYGAHAGYERVVLDLGAGDAPAATVPEWDLVSPPGDGLLRLTIPSISATGVSDGGLGDDGKDAGTRGAGDLLGRFYVVRAPEGGVFVDVFSRGAFAYRVLELSDPARLVVDFKPTGDPPKTPLPAAGGETVLVEPRRGPGSAAPSPSAGTPATLGRPTP